MPGWPVLHQDGIYQVADRDGILYPITQGGRPVSSLQPGWYPVGLQSGLSPFHLLELHNDAEGGQDAVWYLTDELDFITHSCRHFSAAQSDQLASRLTPLLHDIYDQSLCAARPAVAASSHSFDGINPSFVREMIGLVVERAMSPPDIVLADRLEATSTHYSAAGRQLSSGLIRHSLDVAPAADTGAAMLASPFDAALLAVQESFEPGGDGLARAQRFHDAVADAALYLLTPSDGAPALYVPAMHTIFATQDILSGAQALIALFGYYASHTDRASAAALPEIVPAAMPALPEEGGHTAPPTHWWRRMFGLRQR